MILFCFVSLGMQPRACVSQRWEEVWRMLDGGGGRLATGSCSSQRVATMTVARQEPSNKDIMCYFPLLVCRHFGDLQPLLCMCASACVCARHTLASTPVGSTRLG